MRLPDCITLPDKGSSRWHPRDPALFAACKRDAAVCHHEPNRRTHPKAPSGLACFSLLPHPTSRPRVGFDRPCPDCELHSSAEYQTDNRLAQSSPILNLRFEVEAHVGDRTRRAAQIVNVGAEWSPMVHLIGPGPMHAQLGCYALLPHALAVAGVSML